jgi:hypothetical protein
VDSLLDRVFKFSQITTSSAFVLFLPMETDFDLMNHTQMMGWMDSIITHSIFMFVVVLSTIICLTQLSWGTKVAIYDTRKRRYLYSIGDQ